MKNKIAGLGALTFMIGCLVGCAYQARSTTLAPSYPCLNIQQPQVRNGQVVARFTPYPDVTRGYIQNFSWNYMVCVWIDEKKNRLPDYILFPGERVELTLPLGKRILYFSECQPTEFYEPWDFVAEYAIPVTVGGSTRFTYFRDGIYGWYAEISYSGYVYAYPSRGRRWQSLPRY